MGEAILIAVGSGLVAGLVAWGGLRMEVRFLAAGVARAEAVANAAHKRIDRILEGAKS